MLRIPVTGYHVVVRSVGRCFFFLRSEIESALCPREYSDSKGYSDTSR